ncbi:MAG: histidine kinase [Bacteroidetes bacterium]|nr:MAG: histidine kinase [Bacteroidota bacterium]
MQMSDAELLQELERRIAVNRQTVEELRGLNSELKLVNRKLEESESLKSHFISNITNEIINPFTSILGLSRSILSVDKEAWKKVISMVALIHSEAFSLDFQFRNIFFAAKVEAGDAVPDILNVEVLPLVDSVMDNFRYELRKKKVRVQVHEELPAPPDGQFSVMFKTDPSYVKLVLANLLNNAVNYSSMGSTIDLTLRVADGRLSLAVRDYGTGIAEDSLSEIFDRFTRGDTTINSVSRGHGLGLSVCKAITDLLEGTITVESKLGEGSYFVFEIPESTMETEGFSSEANEIFFDDEEIF